MSAHQGSLPSTASLCAQPTKDSYFIRFNLRYRLTVFSRFAAAILAGYLVTACFTGLMPLLLPMKKTDAVLLSLSLSVFIYALAFIWCFYVRSVKRVWAVLFGLSAVMIGCILLLRETL